MANDNPLAQLGVVAAPKTAALADTNPLGSFGVPAQSTQQAVQIDQPSKTADYLQNNLYPKVLAGVNDVAQSATALPKELVAPPQNPTEALLHFVSPGGLPAYRIARNLIQAAERVKTASSDEYGQAVNDYNKTVQQFRQRDWRNAIPSALEVGNDIAGANPMTAAAAPAARELLEGTRPGGNLATPVTKDILTAGLVAAPELAEGGALAPAVSTAAAPPVGASMRVNPFRAMAQGDRVVQPAVQRVAGEAADAAATTANVPAASRAGGLRQMLDQPIADVAARERATYDTLNKAAETDLKDLYDKRSELEDALDDPTRTDSDALERKMEDNNAKIRTGEARAKENGVDPKTLNDAVADSRRRFDLEALKKNFFDNDQVVSGDLTRGSEESVNVKTAIKKAQNLNRPSKFAPQGRLQRILGKQGADTLLNNLYAADRAGQTAIKWNKFAKWAVPASLGSAVTGYEIATH